MIDESGQIKCDNCNAVIAVIEADSNVTVIAFKPRDILAAVKKAGGVQVRLNTGLFEFDSHCVTTMDACNPESEQTKGRAPTSGKKAK